MMIFRVVAAVLATALLAGAQEAKRTRPHLGLESRHPSADEATKFKLPADLAGRFRGQIVEKLEKDGPAEKAGLAVGDVLLQLDENRFYSQDDVKDFISVTPTGTKVVALVRRAKTLKEEKIDLTMRSIDLTAEEAKQVRVTWEFAGPAQLKAALDKAAKEKKLVLVGLSGAET